MTHSQVNYTLSRHFAVGATYVRQDLLSEELEASAAQINILLYRRNRAASQANVYLSLGGGLRHDGFELGDPLVLGALQLDYETDNFYTALVTHGVATAAHFDAPSTLPYSVRGRVGVLPFASDFDGLQAWAVLQADWAPAMREGVQLTPLLRIFYKNVLWEMGASMDGSPWLQMMVHL